MNRPLARPRADPDFRARFTTAEFLPIWQTGVFGDMKIELVDGELERMNPPMSGHGLSQADVIFLLRTALGLKSDLVVYAELGIDLGNDTIRACDAAIARVVPDVRRLLRPDELLLVVEIADDTLVRDLGPKRLDYAGAGIPEYWVVDINARAVNVMREPIDGDYGLREIVRFGEPLAVPGTNAEISL